MVQHGPWGRRESQADARAAGGATVAARAPASFACESCGAMLTYGPGTQELVCGYCGHRNRVTQAADAVEVRETALTPLLDTLRGEEPSEAAIATSCSSCGAEFEMPAGLHAGSCPFCGQPNVVDPTGRRRVVPQAVLPFLIGDKEARKLLEAWLHGLWFAPNRLVRDVRKPGRLRGLYIPHWTFDCATETRYTGRRGDVYYVTRWVTTTVNGRQVRQAVQEPRIRWTPVSGRVARFFDDVLVVAGEVVPKHLVEKLEPWDLGGLKPYQADYLSGFESELYRLPIEDGFNAAQGAMRSVITQDVRHDIGGDQQSISGLDIEHRDPSFKHVLLPVWVAAYNFLGRAYSFTVNARTGEIVGERPWSVWKIAAAVAVALVVIIAVILVSAAAQR